MLLDAKLLQRLSDVPVLGVSMADVQLLRLDLAGGLASGNKVFKLRQNIAIARQRGLGRLLSFGGAWSNHLHALAAVGREQGLETVGIVRGERPAAPSAMLCDASRWGMQLVHVSRQEYSRRDEADYIETLEQRFGPCLVIPEGGANIPGVRGCQEIARLLPSLEVNTVVLAVGTGTTMAGVLSGLSDVHRVLGVSVLKGADDLEDRVGAALRAVGVSDTGNWRIHHEYHCGGYARVDEGLKQFILEFERVQGIPLDPVYTGKMLYAVHSMIRQGELAGNIIAIHSGGLQGRRGFDWCS